MLQLVRLILFSLLFAGTASAQIQVPTLLSLEPLETASLERLPHGKIIPEYVRQNPLEHSPLCRFETRIERKLPIGIWFELGDPIPVGTPGRQNARFQFKLINF